jgi:beta-1,4-N-acetylglucosaminyltransferase
MLMLMDKLDKAFYAPRIYVVAETDRMSAHKALAREQLWEAEAAAQVWAVRGAQRAPRVRVWEGRSGDGPHAKAPASPPINTNTPQKTQSTPPLPPAPTTRQAGGGGAAQPPPPRPPPATIITIPRSREVGQSYATSVFTTLYSLAFAAAAVARARPQLLLANGPGTCIPVAAGALAARALCLVDCRVAYVESIARVRRLSLSARILYATRAADALLVQWRELQQRFPRAAYAGRLY